MDQPADIFAILAWTLPLGLGALAVIISRRWLTTATLARGPSRIVGLGPIDAFVGLALFVGGGTLFAILLHRYLGIDPATAKLREPTPAQSIQIILLGQLFAQAPPVAYFAWRASFRPWGLRRVGLLPKRPLREFGIAAIAFLLVVPVVFATLSLAAAVGLWLGHPPPPLAHEMLDLLVSPDVPLAARIAIIFSAVLIAPALEEGMYRGLLQSSLVEAVGRRRRWPVVLLVSALFAVMHLQAATVHTLPALFVLGAALGWLYERTGSLYPPILLHAAFNAFNVGLALLSTLAPTPPPVPA